MTARIILALVMLLIAGCYLTWRLIGTGKGQHAAPRRYIRDEWPAPAAERVIQPVVVDGRPPWEPVPPPDGYFLAAATVSGGQVTSVRVGVLPPLPAPPVRPVRPALPAYVTDEIGDRTVDDWLESAFTRAMALEVAEMESRDG